mmetsp:Transcript_25475/g.64778  ORF Transcript_25475/g.64778 Transcript_25475/m.64778 type:complete len:231 (+) Transcript_25475:1101-1793(+)
MTMSASGSISSRPLDSTCTFRPRCGSHFSTSACQFRAATAGATTSIGHSSENCCARIRAWNVFPRPISSAIRQRPSCNRPNLTPSSWKGFSLRLKAGKVLRYWLRFSSASGSFRSARMWARSMLLAAHASTLVFMPEVSSGSSSGSKPPRFAGSSSPASASASIRRCPHCSRVPCSGRCRTRSRSRILSRERLAMGALAARGRAALSSGSSSPASAMASCSRATSSAFVP